MLQEETHKQLPGAERSQEPGVAVLCGGFISFMPNLCCLGASEGHVSCSPVHGCPTLPCQTSSSSLEAAFGEEGRPVYSRRAMFAAPASSRRRAKR